MSNYYRYFICLLIFLCYVLVFFHRLCPAVLALDIQASFGLTGTLLGVFSSAYFYSYAIMQLPTGLMADSWGPRKTVSVFFVIAGIGSVVMGISSNLSTAILGRVLVGLGSCGGNRRAAAASRRLTVGGPTSGTAICTPGRACSPRGSPEIRSGTLSGALR